MTAAGHSAAFETNAGAVVGRRMTIIRMALQTSLYFARNVFASRETIIRSKSRAFRMAVLQESPIVLSFLERGSFSAIRPTLSAK